MVRRSYWNGIPSLLILGVFILSAAAPAPVAAAPPAWMPGFPMRAGNAVIGMFMPVPGADGYRVLRKVGSESFAEIYKGPLNNFTDPSTDPTKTYTYKVVPLVGGKDGEPSAEAVLAGKEKIKAPAFGGTLITADAIMLRWNVVEGAAFYNLYRSEDKDGNYKLHKSIQETNFSDKDVKEGRTYYYQVTAVDKMSAESDRSKSEPARIVKEVKKEAKKPVHKKAVKILEFQGERMYEFDNPNSMGISSKGEIYVAERAGIQVMDSKGQYVRRIKFPKDWSPPSNLTADKDDRLVAAFPYEALVRVISPAEGALIASYKLKLPKEYEGKSLVPQPISFAFDPDGNLWVADAIAWQLVILNREGNEIGRVGQLREVWQGKPERPADALPAIGTVQFNPYDGNMYVRIGDGTFKVINAKTRKVVATYGGLGGDLDKFSVVASFGFREGGNFLVFDAMNSEVKEFTKTFDYVQSLGDQVEKRSGYPSFSIPGSDFMLFREKERKIYFVSVLSNKVMVYEYEK